MFNTINTEKPPNSTILTNSSNNLDLPSLNRDSINEPAPLSNLMTSGIYAPH